MSEEKREEVKAGRKARRKQRRKKRRAVATEKERRRDEISGDKAFAATVKANLKSGVPRGVPHCEWDGTDFVPTRPKPPPRVDVNVSIMHAAHKKFGVDWRGSRRGIHQSRNVPSIADSGCQTCSAGTDVLELLGCPRTYLVPTSHQIVGITDSRLNIAGSVMLRIEIGGKITRQMVHVSTNTQGLYLSETALMDLGIISKDFPNPPNKGESGANATAAPNCTDENGVPCIPRTATPDRPNEIPCAPTKENIDFLERWLLEYFSSSAFNTCTHQPLQGMT